MKKELEKNYSPASFEGRIYKSWESAGAFAPSKKGSKSFTVVMPPPNITGQLHMGHALDNTMQDILIRYKRKKGFDTLWLPGTDHASIATEAKIVESMKKEGLTKDDLGREGFLRRAWEWNTLYGGKITEQLRRLGSSCDWTRQRFTLDEGCSAAVQEVFVRLYEQGLIYRGVRIINWCPTCLTSISDAEVEYEDQQGHFWHIKYPLTDGSGYINLATTRPETLLGDVAVAVNPSDGRYKHLVGKTLTLPLVGRIIPIIADDYVEADFGTGAVKITPAHDPNDFEVGKRHGLDVINVMTPDAKITEDYPAYAGMDRFAARKKIVAELNALGLLVKVEPHVHNVGTCYRCGTTIEPRASLQWFVDMKPLAAPAIDAVRDGGIRFVPERFEKNYFHWMENIRDWCVSRQLWWGHRIPAFYCDDCGDTVVTKEQNPVCPKCKKPLRQDPDTLDTWFSSALWPFSTLGWPNESAEDLRRFYPTNALVTGYDIITFWVSRMIFSGLKYTGKAPFDTVLLHGLVRDAQGRKMSKSLGNGIDPLEIIDKYGADALRFALASGNSPGNDMRFSDEKIESARNFSNKLWNAARFTLMNLTIDEAELPHVKDLCTEDKWILTRLNNLCREVSENIDAYELGIALGKIYDFIWDVLCDWYIELIKGRLSDKSDKSNLAAQNALCYVLTAALGLLHPYMPFITEEIWASLPRIKGDTGEFLMLTKYPEAIGRDFPNETADMEIIIAAIRAVRECRAEMNVPPSRKAEVIISSKSGAFTHAERYFTRLASASKMSIAENYSVDNAVQIVTPDAKIYLPLSELIDLAAEKKRLTDEKLRIEGEIARLENKLGNEGFVAKAPAAVIEGEREKLRRYRETLSGVIEAIGRIG